MSETFLTPVGRLVQGDLWVAQTKDQQGNLRTVKTGPNAGQPNPQFFIALAIRKDDPQWPAFWALLDRVARTDFASLFPVPGGPCVNPKFTFKVLDGDGVDTTGKSNATKEGFAGHWVVRFASSFAPKCYMKDHYLPHEQITDPAAIKRGYFIQVHGTAKGNDNVQNPGLYLNFDMVQMVGYGAEITSGPDASAAFGGQAAALPPGASATPMGGPTTPPPPGAPGPGPGPGAPMPPGPPGAAPPPAPPGPAAGGPGAYTPPPPAPPAPPPAPPQAPPAPPAPPARQMTAAATTTYEGYIAAGWTDDVLRAHGLMV